MQEQRLLTARILHRWSFGPRPGQYTAALNVGASGAASDLILSTNDSNADVDRTRTPMPVFERVNKFTAADRQAAIRRRSEQQHQMTIWWLDRMVTTQQPLVERMTWFWHGHWATSINKVQDPRLMLRQNETLRATALGDFNVQTRAMLRDPAMLVWLDGTGNRKGHPNENLGRELLELFTMGVGNYLEQDVREAARALTGWQIDLDSVTSSFNPARFDSSDKTVFNTKGDFDVDSLTDHVLAQPATARFLAQRLWLRHVSETPPSEAELGRLVATISSSYGSYNLQVLVAAMVNETAVDTADRPLAKAPLPWLVGVLRSLNLTVGDWDLLDQKRVIRYLYAMGQVPFVPPSVAGWPSGAAWFTSTAAQARLELSQHLMRHAKLGWLSDVKPAARPAALADHLGVPAWTSRTTNVLSAKANSAADTYILAINAPEYLAGV